jgi:peptidyl-prolyl cis-trans isomerase A (cyclophilin A)
VDAYLLETYRLLGRTGDLLRRYSKMGAPLGDDGRIAKAEDPVAAYYEVLGMHEGDRLFASIRTTGGTLTCELFPTSAPLTVANFVGLSRGTIRWADPVTGVPRTDPLYPTTGFHRVIPDFMIQGGDPNGDGTGGPGYQFVDEIDPGLAFDRPGRLAMANSGPNTNGSQWFVTEAPTEHLTGHHTIFGQCDDATVEVVKGIARVPVGPLDRPSEPVRIESIEIRAEAVGPG